jgi:hypothetical protein
MLKYVNVYVYVYVYVYVCIYCFVLFTCICWLVNNCLHLLMSIVFQCVQTEFDVEFDVDSPGSKLDPEQFDSNGVESGCECECECECECVPVFVPCLSS